jgi:hypothetical protein
MSLQSSVCAGSGNHSKIEINQWQFGGNFNQTATYTSGSLVEVWLKFG